jgi:hypothetical protein
MYDTACHETQHNDVLSIMTFGKATQHNNKNTTFTVYVAKMSSVYKQTVAILSIAKPGVIMLSAM